MPQGRLAPASRGLGCGSKDEKCSPRPQSTMPQSGSNGLTRRWGGGGQEAQGEGRLRAALEDQPSDCPLLRAHGGIVICDS